MNLSGDFTHPAICGFYIASYVKAVLIKKRARESYALPRFCLGFYLTSNLLLLTVDTNSLMCYNLRKGKNNDNI